MLRLVRWSLCLAICACFAHSTVCAQPSTRARRAFTQGSAAYEAGRFEEALRLFREAHSLSNHSGLFYNIGVVAERLQRLDEALQAYEAYLANDVVGDRRANVEGRIAVIRAAIAERRAQQEREAALQQASERERRAAEEAVADARAAAAAAAEAEDEARRAGAVAAEAEEEARRARERASERLVRQAPGAGPWILGGSGVAALATGVALLLTGRVAIENVEQAQRGTEWSDVAGDHDRGLPLVRAGWALAGIGLASVAGGLLWYATGHRWVPETEPAVSLEVGLGGLSLRGSF